MPDLKKKFYQLAKRWKRETGYLSSITQKSKHPAYQEIIDLDWPVVPIILEDLKILPDHWFWALREITGEDPVPVEHAGDMQAMTDDWINWGKKKGLI